MLLVRPSFTQSHMKYIIILPRLWLRSAEVVQRPHLLRFVSTAKDRCDAQTPCAAETPRLTSHLLRKLPAPDRHDHRIESNALL